jgi:hypothetical protein
LHIVFGKDCVRIGKNKIARKSFFAGEYVACFSAAITAITANLLLQKSAI